MRLFLLALAVATLMFPGCAALQPGADYLKGLGNQVKEGGVRLADSFDIDVEGDTSGASVAVSAIGVSGSFGVNWKAVGCVLTAGIIDSLCESDPE